MRKFIIGAVALASAGNAHAAVNIVENGGFEEPTISGSTAGSGYEPFFAGSTAISGWSVDAGSVDLITSPYPFNEGNQALDLTGDSAGTISQVLSTLAGQTYNLVFSFSSNNAAGAGMFDGNVTVGGINSIFSHVNGDPFGTFTGSFVGTGSDTLTFTSLTNQNNGGVVLDAISVSAAPEPAAWLMMIAGFGIVGASLRRKRAAVKVRFA